MTQREPWDPTQPPRTPLVVAHRGASEDEPEHTLAAYRRALAYGADGIECDVRLSRDRELVCIHDRTLRRTSNAGSRVVSKLSLAELEAWDYGLWHPTAAELAAGGEPDPERHRVLTLRPLLELALSTGSEMLVLVETKHPLKHGGDLERRLAALLAELDLASGDRPGMPRVRVMSFSHLALERMSRYAPKVPLVHLIEKRTPTLTWKGWLPHGVRKVGLDIAIVRARPDVVARHHARGHEVAVWTVNEPEDVALCLETGVDVIITNRPGRVAEQVDGRNQGA